MDFSLISGSLSSLATLVELGKAAVGLRDATQVTTIVAQMNDQVLAVQVNLYRHQAELMELQQKYHAAQQELRDLRAKESERSRYELVEPFSGTFVYQLKNSVGGEPSHMLCQVCFDAGKKSILQNGNGSYIHCRLCKQAFQVAR